MNSKSQTSFDLVRLSKSKPAVDLCSNTIRRFASEGLPLYRNGKAVFFSKAELESFIRSRSPRIVNVAN
jgi:hypothetical protein